jgi:hypothetical protein
MINIRIIMIDELDPGWKNRRRIVITRNTSE